MPQNTEPRKGMPSPRLTEPEFRKRFLRGFKGAAFERLGGELDKLVSAAWDVYEKGDKSPLNRKAGPGFADPDYDLSLDWIAAHDAITAAQLKHDGTVKLAESRLGRSRVGRVNGRDEDASRPDLRRPSLPC